MNPEDIIFDLEDTTSKNEKASILVNAFNDLESPDEMFESFRYCFDSLITFGVKNNIKESDLIDNHSLNLTWKEFRDECLIPLSKREVTGNAARDLIESMMERANQEQWNGWYRRILMKDLRCGVSEKTINKALKKTKRTDLLIPVFQCQLASDAGEDRIPTTGEWMVQSKLDGTRLIAICTEKGKKVELFSRNGKQFTNFTAIEKSLSEFLQMRGTNNDLVFDGEVMGENFQDLMKMIFLKDEKKKESRSLDDSIYYIFDWMTLDEFKKGYSSTDQSRRSSDLNKYFSPPQSDGYELPSNIQLLSSAYIDLGTADGQDELKEIFAGAIENGYEGVILKDRHAPYESKRGKSWIKMKPFIEVSLSIVGLEEGKGKFENNLGALQLVGVSDCGKPISVSVGSGLSDKQREAIWKVGEEKMHGMIVEVRADCITQSQNETNTWSLRFPRIKTFRGTIPGEKL